MDKLYKIKLIGSYNLMYVIAANFGEVEDKIIEAHRDNPIRDIESIELISTEVII